MASNELNPLPRVVVPFAFLEPNTDNPGLKDFTPAVVPADTPDSGDAPERKTVQGEVDEGEAGDADDPKADSFVRESAPSSPNPSEAGARSVAEESPADAEKGNSSKGKNSTPKE